MVLKRLFIGDTGDDSTLHIHHTGLYGDIALNLYDSVTQKMVLIGLLISDTGTDCFACSLFMFSLR